MLEEVKKKMNVERKVRRKEERAEGEWLMRWKRES